MAKQPNKEFEEWFGTQVCFRLGGPIKEQFRKIFEAGQRAELLAVYHEAIVFDPEDRGYGDIIQMMKTITNRRQRHLAP